MRKTLARVTVVLCFALVGCTSPPGSTPTAPVAPEASSPSPSPTLPSKAEDTANLKKALLSADDLGSPWVKPKAVSTVQGKKGEVCPGHVSAVEKVPVNGEAGVDLTEGRGDGKNIASIRLSTLPADDDSALIQAYGKDQRACATYEDASGLFVVRSAEGPTGFDGAATVTTWAERIYFDQQHKKLAYARHTMVVRQSRVVTYLSYAFLPVKKDPRAKDFERAWRLLEAQLAKNASTFG